MARALKLFFFLAGLALAQTAPDRDFKAAGVCARCHVISVVEWGMSGHRNAGTTCESCHGVSKGHVVDERNNIKPERIPHLAALAGLCATCHDAGCPKSKQTAGCQDCHHVHALVDPRKPREARDQTLEKQAAAWEEAGKRFREGERLVGLGQWKEARVEFEAALASRPDDPRAQKRLAVCRRRLNPALPGFECGKEWDAGTGLAREARVAGLSIAMQLVPGGTFEMGSEHLPGAQPVHTVRIEPFYLGKYEVSQAEWQAVTEKNPSFSQAASLPVERVSWEDAREFLKRLNARVPGAGFRLPTEAEWEFAAGDGMTAGACFGAEQADALPRAAGQGRPNRFGLYDMQGNVWEWCSSLYAPYPYDAGDGREDAAAPGLRVLRGGSCADMEDLLDPHVRHSDRPSRRLRWNGLRLARSVPEL